MESVELSAANSLNNNPAARLAPYQWKPGQSGNPNGRPKKVATALDKALTKKRALKLADAVITKAEEGDVRAAEFVRDTVDGPLPRTVTGADGGPLEFLLITEHVGRTK